MAGNQQLPVVTIPDELTTQDEVRDFIRQTISRRSFVEAMGVAGLGAVAFQFGCGGDSASETPRQVYVANSEGMVVNDPALCVGCRRCETACTAFNQEGPGTSARPSVSNVKVNRNLLYGALTATLDSRGDGLFGSFRVIGDTCRQCPHPVPCQLACPHGAIEVIEPVNARVVDQDKCQGCGICVEACPWDMLALDGPVLGAATKAHKCNLCGGAPECVAACTAGALKYLPWEDRTDLVPARQVVPASVQLADDVKDTCKQCH